MTLENVSDIYPLSPAQSGMLFHSIAEPEQGAYVNQICINLDGPLEPGLFSEALQTCFSRHDALKTCFVWDGVDEPLQIVREQVEFPVVVYDWSELDPRTVAEHRRKLIEDLGNHPFDLLQAPLIESHLCRLNSESSLLVLKYHHLILDGWSAHLLIEELLSHYARPMLKLEPASSFKNYIAWQKNQDHEKARQFWKEELAGFQSGNQICDRSMHHDTNKPIPIGFSQTSLHCDAELTSRLKQLAQSSRVTLNTVFQAAWSLTISRFSGGDRDIVFGTTVAGRPLELPGVEKTIGSFINTVPFRTQLPDSTAPQTWLGQIQSQQARVREWDFASLAVVQKLAPLESSSDLFESILVFENYPTHESPNLQPLVASHFEHFERSNFPLALIVIPDETIEIVMIANEESISGDRTERLEAQLMMTLQRFAANKFSTVNELAGQLTDRDAEDLIRFGNGPDLEIPHAIQQQSVNEAISKWSLETPAAIAVVQGKRQLSYAELERESNLVAAAICKAGCKPGQLVGLCVDRSLQMLTGILGILKSGCAYVPMDAMYPPEHFRNVITDGQIQFIVTRKEHLDRLPADTQQTHIFIEEIANEPQNESPQNQAPNNGVAAQMNERLAYVIYTSGSTGKPKGVAISHANLTHSTLARTEYYEGNPSSFLLLSSFAFDSSVAGIFWTLMSGGKLVLPQMDEEKDPERLLQIIADQSVSHLLCLPALYRVIAEAKPLASIHSLTTAIVAGEAVTPSVIETHLANLPKTKLYNEYGPSEGTVWATACQLTAAELGRSPSIGKPISRSGVRILDANGTPLPLGVTGEIYLLGDGLAQGYINAPAMTDAKFRNINDLDGTIRRAYRTGDMAHFRPNGDLVFQGRSDEQVKIRGFRIEIGEIESVLKGLDGVSNVVVLIDQVSEQTSARIVAFMETTIETNGERFREQSQKRLPHFMVPDQWVVLEQLPKLSNGKVDRGAIRNLIPEAKRTDKAPPTTATESTLVAIWSDLLGQTDIGIHDNFFSLGGDSIVSIQLISKARREGIFFKPVDVARFPTIAELSKIADSDASQPNAAETKDGPFPLTPIQEWFFENQFASSHHWNQTQLFEILDGYNRDKLKTAVIETIRLHPMLHATFEKRDDGWRQKTNPPQDCTVIEVVHSDSDPNQMHSLYRKHQESLNLTEGPLYRVVLAKNEAAPDHLLFVAHHLVVDVVSWSIITDQITTNYEALINNRPLPQPMPTASYQEWTHNLSAKSGQTGVTEQADFWQSVLQSDQGTDPGYLDDASNTEATVKSTSVTIDGPLTRQLREQANEAYNTTFTELILSSLSLSLCDFLNQPDVVIEIEKHGRDVLDLDTSSTVGWFTSTFPLRLQSQASDLDSTIKGVKETLRSVPNEGRDFGLLRFMNADVKERWMDIPDTPVLFNFLGTSVAHRTDGLLTPVEGAKLTSRASNNRQTHHLEFNATIVDQEFQIELRYNTKRYTESSIQQLLLNIGENLRRIVDHCMQHDRSYTPSDFSESGLSQTELDDLLSDFD